MLIKLGPVKVYSHHLGDYMRRYLIDTPFGTIRLHNIQVPDTDDLHDHPWSFLSIVLRGGYTERTSKPSTGEAYNDPVNWQEVVRNAPSIGFRRATDVHKILSVKPNTWTLCFTNNKSRVWGFWTPDAGFIPWTEYGDRSKKKVDTEAYAARLKEVGVVE